MSGKLVSSAYWHVLFIIIINIIIDDDYIDDEYEVLISDREKRGICLIVNVMHY